MKNFWLLIPFIALSCNQKTETVNEKTNYEDSVTVATIDSNDVKNEEITPKRMPDSVINNSEAVKEVLRSGVMREEIDGQITRNADVSMLPFSIGEEIKNDNQEFVLKIDDYDKPNIVAEIKPENADMNIRFNQIKYADGTTDGPFGRTLNIPNKGKGEIWLIVGKSNTASGNATGNFTVSVD